MTVAAAPRKAGPFTGDGVNALFPFTFKVFQASDLLVVLTNLYGVESVETLTSQYTVTLNSNQDSSPGGTVTMLAAPAAGYLVTLGSQVPQSQATTLTNTGGFFPTVINDMLDRVTILVQQLSEKAGRALSLPVSSTASAGLPTPVGGTVIGWNATGTALVNFVLQAGTSLVDLAASVGSSLVGFIQSGTGAVARTAQDKAREIVSVLDFGADPTGATDSSAAFISAHAATPFPYVPPGTFYVTSILMDGLWGPGKIMYGSGGSGVVEMSLPRSARLASKIQTILGKFGRIGWTSGTFGLVGDSISEGYWATVIGNTWFNKLNKMLNLVYSSPVTGSEPEMTNFADPGRYGVSISGTTSIGANGPVQRSLIMQPGAVVTFTGDYRFVDICYQRSSSGGTITMAYNGTSFKTLSTAGAAANDLSTFSSYTGATASGTYTITCSGAAVEITGLFRLVQMVQPCMFFSRFALSAQSTTMMAQDAVISSQMAHMKALVPASKGVVFCAIMVNNANPSAGSVNPQVYQAGLQKMFARYLNSGYYVVAIGGIRPSPAWTTVLPNYPAISQMQRQVCEQFGVPLIEMEQIDWQGDTGFGGSLLQDGLHPNDAGNEAMLELITDFLSSNNFNPAGQSQPNVTYSWTPSCSWFASGLNAIGSGTFAGRYWINGPRCKVQINMNNLTGTGTPSGGLALNLPFVSNSNMRGSASVGAVTGLTISGGTQWTVQVIPNSSQALLRAYNPVTGVYYDVNSLFTGGTGVLDAEFEYTIQE